MPYASLESFKAARESSALTVLNHVNANLRTENRIFRTETQDRRQKKCGECWANSIVERVDREVELADVVLVPSTFVRRDLIDRGVEQSKIAVVPYGVDTTFFRPLGGRRFGERVRILHVGQVGHRKGLRYLLSALAEIDDQRYELTVVGPVVHRGFARRGISNGVCYRGVLSREHLVQLYSECDAFVLPSLAEGMALVVLEAMACGAPVVVTEACGYEGIVRNGTEGFVVPPRDVDALKGALGRLADPSVRQEMSEAALARAQEYTWDRFKASFLDVLASAMVRTQAGVLA
jgi:glycosyltransferase involved in cell wall biosynthesis